MLPYVVHQECICLGKSKSGFPNPKTDHESIKSTLRVDSSDQIQIQIFEIHNFGKGFEKSIFDKRFFEKRNGTQQMPNISVTLNLCWWRLIKNFEPLIKYHSMFVIYSNYSWTVFKLLLVMFFCTYVVSALRRFIFQVIEKKNSSASVLCVSFYGRPHGVNLLYLL